jgi:hypothetical protein
MKEIKLAQFEFKASHGCFWKFKKCADLHSTKGGGKKAGVDFDAALPFPANLKNSKTAYSTKQIFSTDKTECSFPVKINI